MSPAILLADRAWPDALDATITLAFLGGVLGIVVVGHVLAVLDLRAYLRSLRRSLSCVVNHLPGIPAWARQETPGCLRALGLRLPCREEDVLQAYRERVKRLHPDRGGDRRRFHRLQADFEQALAWVRELSAVDGRP